MDKVTNTHQFHQSWEEYSLLFLGAFQHCHPVGKVLPVPQKAHVGQQRAKPVHHLTHSTRSRRDQVDYNSTAANEGERSAALPEVAHTHTP